ncbi:MAG: hypothetical protein JO171_19415 [Paludibacterium sp.]|uniref:hypothetical protein n=1 Tax=Paludibacterium sp. TaxID=1917523 RepID=UPI0025DD2F86|nr:hypothetical protein [Paludibacterium sp.]MBV8049327.1 hypothetical protein [Paludibacterium sp.]MBV8646994.1 hypothetical protein [Paludibacterium sp.]
MKALRVFFLLIAMLLPLQPVLAGSAMGMVTPATATATAGTAHCQSPSPSDAQHALGNVSCDQHCVSPMLLTPSPLAYAAPLRDWQAAAMTEIANATLAPPFRPPLIL